MRLSMWKGIFVFGKRTALYPENKRGNLAIQSDFILISRILERNKNLYMVWFNIWSEDLPVKNRWVLLQWTALIFSSVECWYWRLTGSRGEFNKWKFVSVSYLSIVALWPQSPFPYSLLIIFLRPPNLYHHNVVQ